MLFLFTERAFFIRLNRNSLFLTKFLKSSVFFSEYYIHLPFTLSKNGKETAHIYFYYFNVWGFYHYYFYDYYPFGVVCYKFPSKALPAL